MWSVGIVCGPNSPTFIRTDATSITITKMVKFTNLAVPNTTLIVGRYFRALILETRLLLSVKTTCWRSRTAPNFRVKRPAKALWCAFGPTLPARTTRNVPRSIRWSAKPTKGMSSTTWTTLRNAISTTNWINVWCWVLRSRFRAIFSATTKEAVRLSITSTRTGGTFTAITTLRLGNAKIVCCFRLTGWLQGWLF